MPSITGTSLFITGMVCISESHTVQNWSLYTLHLSVHLLTNGCLLLQLRLWPYSTLLGHFLHAKCSILGHSNAGIIDLVTSQWKISYQYLGHFQFRSPVLLQIWEWVIKSWSLGKIRGAWSPWHCGTVYNEPLINMTVIPQLEEEQS